jgi:hypothetical protein
MLQADIPSSSKSAVGAMVKQHPEGLHSLASFGITEQSMCRDGIRIDNEQHVFET